MTRKFTLKNINADKGDKVVILGDQYQVMPWQYSKPLVSVLVDSNYLGFVPSGTYVVTTIDGAVGHHREYEIQGPM
ncbi:hypothetical protein [Polaromonas sp.]|uniref:hypothetical protein n=1 Tax=Polaromonas sp. TaxID=1869339 RepID=UPI003BB72A35